MFRFILGKGFQISDGLIDRSVLRSKFVISLPFFTAALILFTSTAQAAGFVSNNESDLRNLSHGFSWSPVNPDDLSFSFLKSTDKSEIETRFRVRPSLSLNDDTGGGAYGVFNRSLHILDDGREMETYFQDDNGARTGAMFLSTGNGNQLGAVIGEGRESSFSVGRYNGFTNDSTPLSLSKGDVAYRYQSLTFGHAFDNSQVYGGWINMLKGEDYYGRTYNPNVQAYLLGAGRGPFTFNSVYAKGRAGSVWGGQFSYTQKESDYFVSFQQGSEGVVALQERQRWELGFGNRLSHTNWLYQLSAAGSTELEGNDEHRWMLRFSYKPNRPVFNQSEQTDQPRMSGKVLAGVAVAAVAAAAVSSSDSNDDDNTTDGSTTTEAGAPVFSKLQNINKRSAGVQTYFTNTVNFGNRKGKVKLTTTRGDFVLIRKDGSSALARTGQVVNLDNISGFRLQIAVKPQSSTNITVTAQDTANNKKHIDSFTLRVEGIPQLVIEDSITCEDFDVITLKNNSGSDLTITKASVSNNSEWEFESSIEDLPALVPSGETASLLFRFKGKVKLQSEIANNSIRNIGCGFSVLDSTYSFTVFTKNSGYTSFSRPIDITVIR